MCDLTEECVLNFFYHFAPLHSIKFIFFGNEFNDFLFLQRSDNDLMFDDSAFSDITNRELVKHNENSRTKVVSKRSINSNNDNESNWWERVPSSLISIP